MKEEDLCKICDKEKELKTLEYCNGCIKDLKEELDDLKSKGFFSKLWNKTVFPDIIKAKKEEKALRKKIQREAKMEALESMSGDLKEHYKQEELNKIKGIKKPGSNFLEKLAKGFENTETNMIGSTDKISKMMGGFGDTKETKTVKYKTKKGKIKTKEVKVNKADDFEEKMKRIIG